MGLAVAENPRAAIGHNQPPPDDDLRFIDARLVEDAARYLQFRFQRWGLDALMAKRKGGPVLAFRRALMCCLKGLVATEALEAITGFNRKTIGEDQQSIETLCEADDAFAEDFENLRLAVLGHVSINLERFAQTLLDFMEREPERRREDKARRKAALELKRQQVARELERQRTRVSQLRPLAAALKSVEGRDAILAAQAGARETARTVAGRTLAILGQIVRAEAKGVRNHASFYSAPDVQECLRLGMARVAEPHLSKAPDPAIGPTAFGARVYAEAIGLKKITLEKKRA